MFVFFNSNLYANNMQTSSIFVEVENNIQAERELKALF